MGSLLSCPPVLSCWVCLLPLPVSLPASTSLFLHHSLCLWELSSLSPPTCLSLCLSLPPSLSSLPPSFLTISTFNSASFLCLCPSPFHVCLSLFIPCTFSCVSNVPPTFLSPPCPPPPVSLLSVSLLVLSALTFSSPPPWRSPHHQMCFFHRLPPPPQGLWGVGMHAASQPWLEDHTVNVQ